MTKRTFVLTTGLVVGLTTGTTTMAVASPAPSACAPTTADLTGNGTGNGCDDEWGTLAVDQGKPHHGNADSWQNTATNGVGYSVPRDWSGHAIVGDGGTGHEWLSPEVAVSDLYGDVHWRVLVQSPFVFQDVPDPNELNAIGFHAAHLRVRGASEAVIAVAQYGHWADSSVESLQFEIYVRSATTGVVTRFLGEVPDGPEGEFFLDNFLPTIQP